MDDWWEGRADTAVKVRFQPYARNTRNASFMQATQGPKHSYNMTQAIPHDKFAISGIRIGIGSVLVLVVSVSVALAVSF